MTVIRMSRLVMLFASFACFAGSACRDSDNANPSGSGGNSGGGNLDAASPDAASPDVASPDTGGADAGPSDGPTTDVASPDAGKPPIYVFSLAIPNADGVLDTYVGVTRSPAFSSIERDKLRMFPPYSGVAVIEGHIFVGDGNGPFVTKYRITDDLRWEPVATINFGDYPLPEGETLNFYFANFKDETTVYHHYGDDKSFRIQWNPREAKIVAAHTDTMLPAPTSTTAVGASGNRTNLSWFKGPVVQPFHQTILATEDYGPESYLAVYDPVTHKEKNVITVPNCPGLEQGTMDENGDLYFATTYNFSLPALFKKGPAACVVKLKADGTLDTSFAPTDSTKWTGGHVAINFRYLGQGKATAHVFHEERVTGVDWTTAPTGEAYWALWDSLLEDDNLWELEIIDLQAGTSKPVTGLKPGHDVGYYGRIVQVDGRSFYVHQLDDGAKTEYYELRTDGTVTPTGEAPGEIWSAFRLR